MESPQAGIPQPGQSQADQQARQHARKHGITPEPLPVETQEKAGSNLDEHLELELEQADQRFLGPDGDDHQQGDDDPGAPLADRGQFGLVALGTEIDLVDVLGDHGGH